ncbi:MAG: hypothetical protein NTV34_16235 [Proteobacteria bacterium]|nr:hypothetical protein [Pseudomonadota bacterium]
MKCKVISGLGEDENGELMVEDKQVGPDRWITSSVDLDVISDATSTNRLFDSINRGAKVIFQASLSKTKGGFLKSDAFYETGELVSREIEIGICK